MVNPKYPSMYFSACLAVDGSWSLMQVTPAFFAATYSLYTTGTTFNFCHFYTHILIHYAASYACLTDVSKYAILKSFAGTFLLFFYFCLLIVFFPVAILLFFAVIFCLVPSCCFSISACFLLFFRYLFGCSLL
jgi:hypothetical protein